ncbi:hypothetical protein TNCV_872711 [Trichonephila clavipes]|nr:hypothetical protein TNCV_872711 [Trichonephila clavipes]
MSSDTLNLTRLLTTWWCESNENDLPVSSLSSVNDIEQQYPLAPLINIQLILPFSVARQHRVGLGLLNEPFPGEPSSC